MVRAKRPGKDNLASARVWMANLSIAFVLKAPDDAQEAANEVKPCFHVVDGSNIQVHETKNTFQSSLAQNAFSKRCIDTELSGTFLSPDSSLLSAKVL